VPKVAFSRFDKDNGRSMGFGMPGKSDMEIGEDISTIRLNVNSVMEKSNAYPGRGRVIPNIDVS